jgi:hypothetical protein
MNNRREPTLATILEEVRQLREDLKSRNRAPLTVPEAAAYLGIPEKSVRNRLGPKATDPFPVTPVRLMARALNEAQQRAEKQYREAMAAYNCLSRKERDQQPLPPPPRGILRVGLDD